MNLPSKPFGIIPIPNLLLSIQILNVIFFSQNTEAIPAREVGYILRSLGQNPTEDEILALVCEAGCDWEVSH